MSDPATLDPLLGLAQAAGLLVEWTDAYGKPQRLAPDAMRPVLEALGLPCAGEAQCRDSLARLKDENQSASLPPLITAETGKPVRLDGRGIHGKAWRIEFEDGGGVDGLFPTHAAMPAAIAPLDRPGYHRLIIGDDAATLAVAPPRCFGVADAAGANAWGLATQLYALRRDGDGGIGDFGALKSLARSAASHGASALAISPVHAMFAADRDRFSPYGPSSRLFLNALHIDPAAVLGDAALAQAIDGLGAAGRLKELERQELIDWPAASALRLALLRDLYRQFKDSGAGQAEFQQFRARGGEALADHARFEALHQTLGGDWRKWPDAYRDPRNPAVDAFAAEHADEVSFHAFLQWQAARGLDAAQREARAAGMPIGLIADLAVGADTGGSQAWSRQDEMLRGLSIGAPPDQLNARGQSWGLGAFSPRAMRQKGFRAYIEMLRAAFAHAGGVRIDHVLGLGRMWLVPERAGADKGAYLRYPIDDLLRLIALESWRHRAIVIGEDLGTVPQGFGERLAQAGVLGIRVLFFQRAQASKKGAAAAFLPPSEWSADAIATTTTHDLPTFAGWWQGRDIEWRARLDLMEEGATEAGEREARAADRAALWNTFTQAGCAAGGRPPADAAPAREAIAFLAATPAPLAVLPIEDALGLTEQWNVPGTVDSHPNWRRRLPRPVDGLLDEPAVAERLSILNAVRAIPGAKP